MVCRNSLHLLSFCWLIIFFIYLEPKQLLRIATIDELHMLSLRFFSRSLLLSYVTSSASQCCLIHEITEHFHVHHRRKSLVCEPFAVKVDMFERGHDV